MELIDGATAHDVPRVHVSDVQRGDSQLLPQRRRLDQLAHVARNLLLKQTVHGGTSHPNPHHHHVKQQAQYSNVALVAAQHNSN